MLGWLMLQSMNALGYLVMTSMYNEDGLCGGGVWGLLYLIALSLLWPVSLSASLILRGGVLFAEFSEAEPSAHIHSPSTSDAEEGCSGDEDEAAKGLYSCNSNIWDAGPYDPPMSICTKVMSKGDHNIMFSVTPDMWMTYNSPESFT